MIDTEKFADCGKIALRYSLFVESLAYLVMKILQRALSRTHPKTFASSPKTNSPNSPARSFLFRI